MKNIKIKIADNLTPRQEALEIAKAIARKSLSGGSQNKEVKRLGNEINIKELETTITITRVSTEKPIRLLTCNVCGCEYQSDMAKYYFHNYGGNRKKKPVCSDECLRFVLDNFGPRVSKSASKLPHPVNYFRRAL